MHRRDLLRGLLGGSALAASGMPLVAFATPPSLAIPTPFAPYKVLEIYLDGGLSAFCTLLGMPFAGNAGADLIYDSVPFTPGGGWSPLWSSVPATLGAVGQYANVAGQRFRFVDGLDPLVTSGVPFRVAVMHHGLEPHEAARPYTLTGNTIGRPQMAGTGNAVNCLHSPQNAAYALHHNRTETALEATQQGLFGGGSTPIILQFDRGYDGDPVDTDIPPDRLAQLDFDRQQLPAQGHLRDHFVAAYADKLTRGTDRVRSKAFDAFAGSWSRSGDLSSVHADIAAAGTGRSCDDIYQDCAVGLVRAGASLLASGARYVLAVAEGFDTHALPVTGGSGGHAFMHGAHLARLIGGVLNAVDFSDTLVVFTTEFGRVATPSGTLMDAHWPHAYAQLAIGGPVVPSLTHVVGGVDGAGIATSTGVRPAEFRAAVLYAAGIDAGAALGASPDTYGTVVGDGSAAFNRLFQ